MKTKKCYETHKNCNGNTCNMDTKHTPTPITIGIEVKRKDNGKIYHEYSGKVVRHQIWDRITIEGEQIKVPMFAIKDRNGVVWYGVDELEAITQAEGK